MANMKAREIADLIAAGRRMYEGGLTTGTLGAIGARLSDGSLVVTAAGTRIGFIDAGDLLVMNGAAPALENGRKPGRETGIIRAVFLAQPQAGSVIRINSPYTTALAHKGKRILETRGALLEDIGGVSYVPFYRPGTAGLAGAVAEVMRASRAAIIQDQGAVVWGTDVFDAIDTAEALEAAARVMFILEGSDGS